MTANPRRQRWYGRMMSSGPQAPIQRSNADNHGHQKATLPAAIVRAAAAEYNRQGYDQSYETLCRRGGLSDYEIIALLADALGIEIPTP